MMRFFLFFITILVFRAQAAIPGEIRLPARFNEEKIKKGKVLLSEVLGPDALLSKDVRLKYSPSIRFDAHYHPTDEGDPLNLPLDSIKAHVEHAHKVLKKVKDNNAFTSLLNGKEINLPIGIKRTVGNKDIILCLDSIIFTPTKAYAVLYAIIDDTKNDKTLAFWGKDIEFTKTGGFTGDGKLKLLQTYSMNFGPKVQVHFLVDRQHQNFLTFDCNGFKQLHIDTRIDFSSDFIKPDNEGTKDTSTQVRMGFISDITSLDNFIVELNDIKPFQIKGLEGFTWSARQIAFDQSSTLNSSGFYFPPEYPYSEYEANRAGWEGFYLSDLVVKLPKEFNVRNDSTRRIEVSIPNALFDRTGFSGLVRAERILPMSDGVMGEFEYGIDEINVHVIQNSPLAANIKGQLHLPMCEDGQNFALSISVQPNHHYQATASSTKTIDFTIFGKASIEIYDQTELRLWVSNQKFNAAISLYGKMEVMAEINGSEGSNKTENKNNILRFKGVELYDIVLSSTAPFVALGPHGGFGTRFEVPALAEFPVTIKGLGLVRQPDSRVGLITTLYLNFLGETDPGTFSPELDVMVVFERKANRKWGYYRTVLPEILINVDISSVGINGRIRFFRDDLVYGSGFSAQVQVSVEAMGQSGFSANVLFGKIPNQDATRLVRYWYVDAKADFGSVGLTVLTPNLIVINGLGMGAYYHMSPYFGQINSTNAFSSNGVTYVPDLQAGLGLKAMLSLKSISNKVITADLAFEISFDTDGSLNAIVFSGKAEILSLPIPKELKEISDAYAKLQKDPLSVFDKADQPISDAEMNDAMKEKSGGSIMAKWVMFYNHDTKEFIVTNDVFVNVASIITGGYEANRAGTINLYFSPNKWFVHVGKPKTPLKVEVLHLLKTKVYFVMGQDLPSPILYKGHGGFSKNTRNKAELGQGFGAGVRADFDKRTKGNIAIYANGGIGTDIFFFNQGQVYCEKIDQYRGIKNWYMFGQAYAYVSAGVTLSGCIQYYGPDCHCGGCVKIFGVKVCGPYLCCWKWKKKCLHGDWDITVGKSCELNGIHPTNFTLSFDNPIKSFDITIGKECSN